MKKLNNDDDQDKKPKKNYQTIRLVCGLLFVSGLLFYAFWIVVCDDKSLECKSLYEWEEIIGAILIVLLGIIGSAAITAVLFKLLRKKKQGGVDWDQMIQNKPDQD